MPVTSARYATPHGSKYLQQLCKHFGHKIELTYDATSASVPLPPGNVTMTADAGALVVRIVAEDIKSIHARFIIDSHLVPFAARENFTGWLAGVEELTIACRRGWPDRVARHAEEGGHTAFHAA